MTGPEHYREAERLITDITRPGALLPQNRILEAGDHSDVLALAQVHATLAVAAATALNDPSPEATGMPAADWDMWLEAASKTRKQAEG